MSNPGRSPKGPRSIWPVLASLIVSGSIIYYLLSRLQWAEVGRLLADVDPVWMMAAFSATCLAPLFATLRFWGIVCVNEQTKLPFKTALSLVAAANVLNLFLPGKGGDAVKALYYRKRGLMSGVLGTVMVERVIDLGILGLLGALSASFLRIPWAIATGLVLFLAALGLVSILILAADNSLPAFVPAAIDRMVSQNGLHFAKWFNHKRAVLVTLSGSAGCWSVAGLIVGSLVAGIHGATEWLYVFAILPLAIISGLVPFTVSGIGTRDAAFVALLEKVLTPEESTLVALGYTVFGYWIVALVGMPVAARVLRSHYMKRFSKH